jgi:small subunit ribosomal protein S5
MNILEKNIMRPKRHSFKKREEKEFDERVLEIARVSRVVKGGRRIRFRATVAVGDHKGRVGVGCGKANEVSVAVQKAATQAKKRVINVPIIDGTIPYEIIATYGAAKVLLKPASSGSSIVAGGAVRNIVELAGITDILAKILGSKSLINNSVAVLNGLNSFNPEIIEKIKKFGDKDLSKKILKENININEEKKKNN